MEKSLPTVEFDQAGNFIITGKVYPETLFWEKSGKPISTDYLFNSTTKQGEGFLAIYEGFPVNVSLKMIFAKNKARASGAVAVPAEEMLAKFRANR